MPVLQVADLGQELVVLVQERGVLAGEFVEAALVFGLVLGDVGIVGDQLVDRLGGSTHAGEELVGFDVQVGVVEFGAHGLVDQLVDLVPVGEEVVDGVEERCRDLLFADVRGRASGRRSETGSSNPRMATIYGLAKALDPYPQPPTNTRSPTLNSEEPLNATHANAYATTMAAVPAHVRVRPSR